MSLSRNIAQVTDKEGLVAAEEVAVASKAVRACVRVIEETECIFVAETSPMPPG